MTEVSLVCATSQRGPILVYNRESVAGRPITQDPEESSKREPMLIKNIGTIAGRLVEDPSFCRTSLGNQHS